MAAQNGYTEIVKLLLEKNADVNLKRTSDGLTALWMAAQDGHTEIVKLLLEKNADVNLKCTNGGPEWLYRNREAPVGKER
ncbi:MAG: ankyrin repeat domain-containing protein, partial [Planctomycetota bacterium]|jgi:serine/threonine-protein phosphatase 6 regulatory ankyrin repeat subunit B